MKEYINIPGPNGTTTRKLSDLLEEHSKITDPLVVKKTAMARKTFEEVGFPEAILTPEQIIVQRARLAKRKNK